MRKKLKIIAVILGLFMALSHKAYATLLPQPKAAYDADVALDFGATHITSTINADGLKEKRIVDMPTGKQTLLIRRDQNKVYLLMPALNTAMTLDSASLGGFDLNLLSTLPVEAEGQEAVNGLHTTRYHVTGETKQGSFDGHVWETGDGILVKADGTATHADQATPVKVTTSNLHIRPQDPAQFEVPAGTKIMPFSIANLLKGSMSGMSVPKQP